jgi:hypothetical protein
MPRESVAAAVLACVALLAVPWSSSRGQSRDDALIRALRQSDLVAGGTVADTRAFPLGPAALPGIHTSVVLDIELWLRSDVLASTPTVQFWTHGGTIGDQRRVVVGQPQFRRGEHVVVLLRRDEAGALWPASASFGKLPLAADGSISTATVSTSMDTLRRTLEELR